MPDPIIHSVEYHKGEMSKRDVEAILSSLAHERAEEVGDTLDLLREVRQSKQNRHSQINKNVAETHLEKKSLWIDSCIAGTQILASFASQSPLAHFIEGITKAGGAANKYLDSEKQASLQLLNHSYQDLGGLVHEGTEELRQASSEFKQAMQDKSQILTMIQRLVEGILSS